MLGIYVDILVGFNSCDSLLFFIFVVNILDMILFSDINCDLV